MWQVTFFFCYNQRCGNKTQNLDFQSKTYFGKRALHAGCVPSEEGARVAGDVMEAGISRPLDGDGSVVMRLNINELIYNK